MNRGIVKTSDRTSKEYKILGINPPLFGVHGGLLIVSHHEKIYSCVMEKIFPTTCNYLRYRGKFKKTLRKKRVPTAQPVQKNTLF